MQQCWMIKAEIRALGEEFPRAVAIIITPTEEEGHLLAEAELKPYLTGWPARLGYENIGNILFTPVATTIFLSTTTAGRIK